MESAVGRSARTAWPVMMIGLPGIDIGSVGLATLACGSAVILSFDVGSLGLLVLFVDFWPVVALMCLPWRKLGISPL